LDHSMPAVPARGRIFARSVLLVVGRRGKVRQMLSWKTVVCSGQPRSYYVFPAKR
jgi:hypothetical protein